MLINAVNRLRLSSVVTVWDPGLDTGYSVEAPDTEDIEKASWLLELGWAVIAKRRRFWTENRDSGFWRVIEIDDR